jgi:hypothetical protein
MAFGQGLTGNLSGVVTQAAIHFDVTVTASSQSTGHAHQRDGQAGGYGIGALPPGDYHITFELAGMNSMTKTARRHRAVGARG